MEKSSQTTQLKEELIQKEKIALSNLKLEQWQEALNILQQAEDLLEQQASNPHEQPQSPQDCTYNSNIILSVLYNSAVCYQRLENYEDVAIYLDGCIYNLKFKNISIEEGKTNSQKLADKIKKLKLQCRVSVQLCAFLSQLNKHEEALYHAKNAVIYARKFIQETVVIINEHERRHQKLICNQSVKNRQILENPGYHQLCQLVQKASPVINSMKDRLNGDRLQKAVPINMRSAIGVQHQKE